MTAQILDGRAFSEQTLSDIRSQVDARIKKDHSAPGLAVILVGDDPASGIYVRKKGEACERAGIQSFTHKLSADTTEQTLITLIDQLNADNSVHGILVQLPLPQHINSDRVLDHIAPHKDVDGFHPYNLGLLAQKRPGLRPCTPYGIIRLLNHYNIDMVGKYAVVVGASNIVGRPMALELMLARATVTVCHSATQQLNQHVSNADILVCATGKPDLVNAEWIKPGAIVIDVGIHRVPEGGIRGDINYTVAAERASSITPVPGGVGPMTVATLLYNTLQASIASDSRNISSAT